MKLLVKIFCFLFLLTVYVNGEEKNVNKKFKIEKGQRIHVIGISSLDLKITGWNKNEAEVNAKAKVTSSDNDFAKEYLQYFDIVCRYQGNDVFIEFKETDKQGSWSPLDVFRGEFKYSFSKNITAEISLPLGSIVYGDLKISIVSVTGLTEQLNLRSNGSKITIRDCRKLGNINSDYDELNIYDSGGMPEIEAGSSKIKVDGFEGLLKISANSGSLSLSKIKGSAALNLTNITATIDEISRNLYAKGFYSDLTILNSAGFVDLEGTKNNFTLNGAAGFKIKAEKSNLMAEKITAGEKGKVFITTNEGSYKILNSTGQFFIDADHTDFEFNNTAGAVYFSASNSTFTGSGIKGEWQSDSRYSAINLYDASLTKIDVTGNGKLFKLSLASEPKTAIIKNKDADVVIYVRPEIRSSVFLTAHHGAISSDFNLNKEKLSSGERSARKFNGGGAVISIETDNGNIGLKKIESK